MAKKGRTSTYTESIGTEICERLGDGEPLRQICRDEKMPHWNTIYNWMEKDEDFAVRIARAREAGHDAIAEEALQIANTPIVGQIKTTRADGVEVKEEDMLGHRKLQIETRLKLLAKWNPKRYGDKIDATLRGDPSAPLQLILNGSDVNG